MTEEHPAVFRIAGRMVGCDPDDLPRGLHERAELLRVRIGDPLSPCEVYPHVKALVERWTGEHGPVPYAYREPVMEKPCPSPAPCARSG